MGARHRAPPLGRFFVYFGHGFGAAWKSAKSGALDRDRWYTVAETYDGARLRVFVDGILQATEPMTGSIPQTAQPLRIGSVYGVVGQPDWFNGVIDEVHVSNVVRFTDHYVVPNGPATADANTRGLWHLDEGTGSTAIDSSSFLNHGTVSPQGASWTTDSPFADPDTVPPVMTGVAVDTITATTATVTWDTDEPSTTQVAYGPTSAYGSTTTEDPIRVTGHGQTLTGLNPSTTYHLQARSADLHGQESTSADVTFTTGPTSSEAAVMGQWSPLMDWPIVAVHTVQLHTGKILMWDAWERPSHPYVYDPAAGTWDEIPNPYGLWFNGTSGSVTVPDDASLDLTNRFTLSAWIRPTTVTGWRTVLMKERPGGLEYALYGGDGSGRAAAYAFVGGDQGVTAPSALPADAWRHLASTYDGGALRLYTDGVLVATRSLAGAVPPSTGALKIGGNAVWSEWFSGLIDDVRVYNRALTATEIAGDMNTPVTPMTPPPPDTQPPTAPSGLTATAAASTVTLGWAAATDNVGVTGYDVHRSTTAGFTPSPATLIATTVSLGHVDAGLAPGTYHYRVIARDLAGLSGPPSAAAQATIQGDLSTPTMPTNLVATGGIGQVGLSWTASTDDVVVSAYDVHRSTTPGFDPSDATHIGTVTATTYLDSNLPAGTYRYRVVARDAAGRSSEPSSDVPGISSADGPPTVAVTAPTADATVAGTVQLTAAAGDDVGIAGVQFRVDGASVGAEDTTSPYAATWNSTVVPNGSHTITALARDSAGNVTTSATVAVTVANAAPTGLVAAYGFNGAAGSTVGDSSGLANTGTISGATRTAAGRVGGALTFDGVNDSVTIPDATSLDLTGSFTLSAWLRPSTVSGWRTVILKEGGPTGLAYGLHGSTNSNRPGGYASIGGADRELNATAPLVANAWRHLALTYDGATMRIYIDGALVGTRSQTGTVTTTTGTLRIGGNSVWGEWFAGQIDEVRVYNRALTAAEITNAMNTPI